MSEDKFKQDIRFASCARAPWARYIEPGKRDEIMRKIRIECIQFYGHSMDTCDLKSVCIGKKCLGRQLPFLSPTAKPYLDKLVADKRNKVKEGKFYVVDNCNDCPIRNSCTSVCPMMNDFLNRHQKKQPDLIYQETLDNYVSEGPQRPVMPSNMAGMDLPWDCLKDDWKRIVKLRLNQRKDFLTIANTCGLFDQAAAKKEFYYALTKLAEYAIVREFLKEKREDLTLGQFEILTAKYIENKSRKQIATERNMTYDAVRNIIYKTLTKHDITWPIYVTTEQGKIRYNIPEVLQ